VSLRDHETEVLAIPGVTSVRADWDLVDGVPTVVLRYPSQIPGMVGHHWSSGIAMATPIAHKGAVAGAKVQALTLLDLLLEPELVDEAGAYFEEEQTAGTDPSADTGYTPFIAETDEPAIWLNQEIMERWRPLLEPHYSDPERFDTYLEQLGIEYPTIRGRPVSQEDGAGGAGGPGS